MEIFFGLDKCAAIVFPAKGVIVSSALKPVSRRICFAPTVFPGASFCASGAGEGH